VTDRAAAPTAPDASQHPDDARRILADLRRSIDNLDAALIHLIAERFRLTRKVGALKAEHDLPPGDPEREAAMLERLRERAVEADLDPDFAEKLLRFIIREVIQHHRAIKG